MLFGCQLRWTQKFPGTKRKAKLVKSTAVMMLGKQSLCPRRQGPAPGLAYTGTDAGSGPTACTAPCGYLCLEPCLFISSDEGLHVQALAIPPASSRSLASPVGGRVHRPKDPGKRACPELFGQEISAAWYPGWGDVGSRDPFPLTLRAPYPVGGSTGQRGSEWDPGQGPRDQV